MSAVTMRWTSWPARWPRPGIDGAAGAVVVTSRVSVEMVQKTAAIGAPFIIAVSAPTALAIRTAEEAGMTLVALVRGDDFDIFTHPERISPEPPSMSHDRTTHAMNTGRQAGLHGQPDRAPSSSRCRMTKAAAGVAKHINDFWDPRMRRQFFEIVEAGGAGLSPLVMEAVGKIRRPAPAEKPASAA